MNSIPSTHSLSDLDERSGDSTYLATDPDHNAQERIVVRGEWLKIAEIEDEQVRETSVLTNTKCFLEQLSGRSNRADLFKFSEAVPNDAPALPYHFEWDNLAVVPITTYQDWWEKRATQVTRKNVRRAQKRGVVVRTANLDDELACGIKAIYDETPIRQGRRFWHYGKEISAVKEENATYADQSEFICAFHGNELIGFIRLVYVGQLATIMQILSKNGQSDKRPTNALIAKAVERCCEKKVRYLVYGRFVYGKNTRSPLIEFKRRNGFEKVMVRTYYVPLTTVGKVALALNLHLGIKHFLPENATCNLLALRAWLYSKHSRAANGEAAD